MSQTYTHVIHDDDNIHGAGASEEAAWADYNETMCKAGIDPDSMEKIECSPCSALISGRVENQGTGFSWSMRDGVTVTREEARS